MRHLLIGLLILLGSATSAIAQVSIGIHLSLFPEFVRVPGYPVYYAPRLDSNFFFYDGMYWVYQRDHWYASSWYNGPWVLVVPEFVPLFILRVPVRYYRLPPGYFYGWRPDAPPRWGEYWGREWEQHRRGWDKWDRRSAPAPAPLPVYQRQYSGDRYPQMEQQQTLHSQNYRYQPRDAVVRQHYQGQAVQRAPAPSQREQPGAQQERQRSARQQDIQRPDQPPPLQQGRPAAPRAQPPQRGGEEDQRDQRSAPGQARPQQQRGPAVQDQQQPPQGAAPREQQTPRASQENVPKGKGAPQEPRRKQGQGKDRDKDEDRGQDRK